ncbi:hypothetical protein [Bounagaea algeriensis]
MRYDVWIGGDVLGYVRRSVRPRGWQAYTTTGMPPVRHVGRGRVARTRQDAVMDLLTALGVQAGIEQGLGRMGTPHALVM